VDVVDGDVDFDDLQARHALDGREDVAADGGGEIDDGGAVCDDEVDVDGGLGFADLDLDALAHVGGAAGDALAQGAQRAGGAAAEAYTPLISRVASPAIFETTTSAIWVRPLVRVAAVAGAFSMRARGAGVGVLVDALTICLLRMNGRVGPAWPGWASFTMGDSTSRRVVTMRSA